MIEAGDQEQGHELKLEAPMDRVWNENPRPFWVKTADEIHNLARLPGSTRDTRGLM